MNQLGVEEMPDNSDSVGTLDNNLPVLIYIATTSSIQPQ